MVCWPPRGGQPAPPHMFILYLDESGTDSESRHFALAGLAVFERQTYFLSQNMEAIAQRYFGENAESVEFHSSALMAQQRRLKPPFSALDFSQRVTLRNEVYQIIAESNARLFGVAVEKNALDEEPYEYSLEQILSRFDRMLGRFYRDGNQERGIVVAAESSYRENLNALGRRVWNRGHRWGELKNLADVPFFAHAKSSRLLQLSDFVVNAIYRRYEEGDTRQFDKIAPKFDEDGGHLHGLVHHASTPWNCFCPACMSRRLTRPQGDGIERSEVREAAGEYS